MEKLYLNTYCVCCNDAVCRRMYLLFFSVLGGVIIICGIDVIAELHGIAFV